MGIGADGPQEGRQFLGRDVGVVLGRLALQEAAQSVQGVMHGAASDAGQVVDFLAGAAHAAHLLDDALLLHALEELHPLDGQYLGVQALAEYGEGMQLQGADGALGGVIRPTR
ncbi:hypothetical protein D9M68_654370 [compost metagenome]